MTILKPYITGKYSEKRKNQPTENQKNTNLKYKLSVGPVYAFSLPVLAVRSPGPPSVIPLLFTQYKTTWLG